MRTALSKQEQERLFLRAADGELSPDDDAALQEAVARDPALKARLAAYTGAIARLRDLPRERAPQLLSSIILRRSRRRRSLMARASEELAQRLPVEVIIPLLLAVSVAAFLLLAGR